jgi:hypothetical protein
VADILRAHADDYRRARGVRLTALEDRVLRELTTCRTAALGGHTWMCDACGHTRVAYNSCRNRHCPTCGGPRRARWLERLRSDLLPVPYFHLVFTIPHELSRLALANRRAVYGLLFQAAGDTLRQLAADPEHLGARVGAVMVLHTWGQNLEHHPHLHCVVPGGGLSPDGQQWIASHATFFLPVVALSRLFRGKFLAGLKRLHRQGKLKLADKLLPLFDAQDFAAWLQPLYQKDWVVYVQPPVSPRQGPDAVLKYLARYVAGAAISDTRLISHTRGQVTFRVKNYRQGRKRETLTLPGVEFVRRFLLHVLPRGFMRVRYYGLLANTQRAILLPRCRERLGVPLSVEPPDANTANQDQLTEANHARCPACGTGSLWLIESIPRPTRQSQPSRACLVPPPPRFTATAAPPPDSS